jgi:serine/threonine-protein kinase
MRASAPEPDEIAGRYQIVQKLGAGAFGTVYKAKDRILGRMVAIKTIRLEGLAAAGASLDELVNRFKREAMVSAQLKHPNIVTIYDIGESNGTSYLAMEFIDGVGLDRMIAAAGRLPVERAASLAGQVADGLDFAHRHNVVHRDIKPANIMVEAGDRVKVTDFGIARVIDSVENLTATGSLLGTPSYMSPEQARGSALDGRSDLFAVGCILYEMVVGKKAFRGESITGLIFKIITEEPPPMREHDPTVPDELVRIVAKALAKLPEARYQSGRELADDLLTLTRAGSTPTLRQSELATTPGLTPPGTLPTLNVTPTMAGDSPTHVAAAQTARPGAPAPPTTLMPPPAEPTRLVSPPAEPTRLVSPPVARPRPTVPPPIPAGAPPVRREPAVPAAPAKSRAGLFVGAGVIGLLLLIAAGAAAFLFLRPRSEPPVAGTISTETPPPATLAVAPPATTMPTTMPPEVATATPEPAAAAPAGRTAAGRTAQTGVAPGASSNVPSGPGTTAAVPPPPPVTAPAARDAVAEMFEREPPRIDGREAGERLADSVRSDRGSNSSFGTNRRFRAREKFPRDVTPAERRGVFVLLNVLHYQALHRQRTGTYGTFQQVLPRPVASPDRFEHAGYRFDMTVEPDGFKVVATPQTMGLRGFVADDTGFVRYADE